MNTSSDMVQVNVTAVAAGICWPGDGTVIATVGRPFAAVPGSIAREKSGGSFVSVQLPSRWRICPGPGASASPRIVLPGSQDRVPLRVALNSTRSTTISCPPAVAAPPLGFRYTSFNASPVGVSQEGEERLTRTEEPGAATPVKLRLPPWYEPGASRSR